MKKFITIVNGVNIAPMWKNNEKESRYQVVNHFLYVYLIYPNDFKIECIKHAGNNEVSLPDPL